MGRLPVLGILDELDEAALIEILTKPRNAILKQYSKLFDYENVKVTFSEDAAREIAREALQRKVVSTRAKDDPGRADAGPDVLRAPGKQEDRLS